MIEFGAAHLKRVRPALIERLGKLEADGLVVYMRFEFGGVLANADRLQLVPHPQPLQNWHVKGQQRFANVKARVMLLIDHGNVAALLRQQCGDGRSGRAAADHENFAMAFRFGNVLISSLAMGAFCEKTLQ